MAPTNCHHCGAAVRSRTARFCEFCGTELVREDAPRARTPDESRRERFELLRRHPDLEPGLRHTPDVRVPKINPGLLIMGPLVIAFLIFFVAQAGNMGAPIFFFIVPAIMFVAIANAMFRSVQRGTRVRAARWERLPAIVVDERTRVSGGGKNSRASTSYFATLEFEDGARREYRVTPKLSGDLSDEDAGIAYVKHDTLLEFRRISV